MHSEVELRGYTISIVHNHPVYAFLHVAMKLS